MDTAALAQHQGLTAQEGLYSTSMALHPSRCRTHRLGRAPPQALRFRRVFFLSNVSPLDVFEDGDFLDPSNDLVFLPPLNSPLNFKHHYIREWTTGPISLTTILCQATIMHTRRVIITQ